MEREKEIVAVMSQMRLDLLKQGFKDTEIRDAAGMMYISIAVVLGISDEEIIKGVKNGIAAVRGLTAPDNPRIKL